ncbi:MAG: class II aldolase/adducin family protein, partial [Chloroflexota bacterium]|nr:class II aldolase/adducin family protein [Chloroflexota bacterium]
RPSSPSVLPASRCGRCSTRGAVMGPHVPLCDIATDFGPTDLMVTSLERGRSLARSLGSARVALMRGHGCVVVGASIPEVVFVAVYTQLNAQIQLQVQQLGGARFLTAEEIELAAARQLQPLPIQKAWGYWRTKAHDRGSFSVPW